MEMFCLFGCALIRAGKIRTTLFWPQLFNLVIQISNKSKILLTIITYR